MQHHTFAIVLALGAMGFALGHSKTNSGGESNARFVCPAAVEETAMLNNNVAMRGLSTVILGVSDLARSRKFYVETLGMTVRSESPEFIFLDAGSTTIGLTEEITLGKPPVAGTSQLVFAVDDVRATHRGLSKRSVLFVHGPRVVDGKNWAAAFRDPDGHLLGVFGPEGVDPEPPSTRK